MDSMYCDFCGAIKTSPDSSCPNCGTKPDVENDELASEFVYSDGGYGRARKGSFPTWAIVVSSVLAGVLVVTGLSFTGILGSLNPFSGPVEDSELNVVTFAVCAESEGYVELTDSVYSTFMEQSDALDNAFGFDGTVNALRTSGAAFSSLGDDFQDFNHCGSNTFYENNQEIGSSLNRMGSKLSELPEDTSELDEISRIISDAEILLDRVEADLGVQQNWLEGFVDF